MGSSKRLYGFLCSLCFVASVSARLVNVTVDDTYGDPETDTQIVYGPPTTWQRGQDCEPCTAKPDPSQAWMGSWQDGTFSRVIQGDGLANQLITATLSFEGIAVYIYCIVAHSFKSPIGDSLMHFYIDGELVGAFIEPPTGDATYQYNRLVYSNTSLSPGPHNVQLVNGQVNGNQTLTLLDYIVYTREVIETTESPALSPTSIVSLSHTNDASGAPSPSSHISSSVLHKDATSSTILFSFSGSTSSLPALSLPLSTTQTETTVALSRASSTTVSSATPSTASLSSSSLTSAIRTTIITAVSSVVGTILVVLLAVWLCIFCRRRRARRRRAQNGDEGAASYISQENPTAVNTVSVAEMRAGLSSEPFLPQQEWAQLSNRPGVLVQSTAASERPPRSSTAFTSTTISEKHRRRPDGSEIERSEGETDMAQTSDEDEFPFSEISSMAPPSYHA